MADRVGPPSGVRFLLWITVCLMGCGGSDQAYVDGRIVKQNGEPLISANVIARPLSGGPAATGVTDQDGFFSLKMPESGHGIPPGEYNVLVAEDRGPMDAQNPPSISLKYTRESTTDLSFEVAAGDRKTVEWTLDPPGAAGRPR